MKRSLGLATVATFGFAAPAPALVVWNLNDLGGAGISTPARQSFEVATRYWSSILEPPSNVKDNVTINLDIGFKPAKDPKELGRTESQTTEILVAKIYDVLRNGGKDPIDETAVSHLPALRNGGLAFGTHGYSQPGKVDVDTTTSLFDDDGSKNNTVFELSNTLTKSLGFQTEDPTVADAQIVFNSAFDFDPSDGISSGSYDFLAIVTHELGHALGFVSGVDTIDTFGRPGGPGAQEAEDEKLRQNDEPTYTALDYTALDLFRYGERGVLDFRVGGTPHFSVDGGVTPIAHFSTGEFNGDGFQAGHWSDNLDFGLMKPASPPGAPGSVEAVDLAAFAVMGYNLREPVTSDYRITSADIYSKFAPTPVPVPLPAGWSLSVAASGFSAAVLRRSRSSSRPTTSAR